MAITEEDRRRLYEGLEGVIGTDRTNTLMASLPPTGWGDVVTKRDLSALEGRLEGRMDRSADRLRADLTRQMFGAVISIIVANAAITAAIVGIAT